MSTIIERSIRSDPYGDYPMPWCLECRASEDGHGPTRPGQERRAIWRCDDEVGVMERWLREFTDEGSGTSCPPPMS